MRHPARAPIEFGLVDGSQHDQALAILLTGRPWSGDPAVGQFLAFAESQHLSLRQLWGASSSGRLLATALVVPNRGRAGMIFISPVQGHSSLGMVSDLVRAAVGGQDPEDLTLLQALLDPHQRLEARALGDAGFRDLAHLLYMHRRTDLGPCPLELEPGIRVVRWSESARPIFAAAILASYEQTLDCRGLLGLRDIQDIIEGHMATGCFEPDLWSVLAYGDEPVGVMLLNPVPQRAALELVYLGFSVPWRRRGLGKRMVRYGLGVAPRYDATSMLLAVDQNNAPAIQMYRALGFQSTARKRALIRALGPRDPL